MVSIYPSNHLRSPQRKCPRRALLTGRYAVSRLLAWQESPPRDVTLLAAVGGAIPLDSLRGDFVSFHGGVAPTDFSVPLALFQDRCCFTRKRPKMWEY